MITMSVYRKIFERAIRNNTYFVRKFSSKGSYDPVISELNKEMETIFGESPSTSSFYTNTPQQTEPGVFGRNISSRDSFDHVIADLNKEMKTIFAESPSANFFNENTPQQMEPSLTHTNGTYDPAILELNKEMETIFGEPPSTNSFCSDTPQQTEQTLTLTHVDSTGKAEMVDISAKSDTKRLAIASCKVILGQKVFNLVASNQIAKGDVLNVAKLAGIMGAKNTSNLIPLCHNINLSNVRVDLSLNESEYSVEIEGEAVTTGKTGVEMEALTAVSVAGLTVYDMCKAASKEICITDICLNYKSGGKSGDWSRK